MGIPSDGDNWGNYNASSVMNHLDNIRQKQFLLIHGNADDNVHYQNSMLLARALEKADIMFQQLSYPEVGNQFVNKLLYFDDKIILLLL